MFAVVGLRAANEPVWYFLLIREDATRPQSTRMPDWDLLDGSAFECFRHADRWRRAGMVDARCEPVPRIRHWLNGLERAKSLKAS